MLLQYSSTMNEETNVDVSYLSCDINGTRYIYKIAADPLDVAKDATSSEEQNTIDVVKEPELEKEEEPISVVCLNGQMYVFQNGVLQELDTTQPMEQMDCHDKTLLVSKDVENCENEYIANGNIVVENAAYEPSEEQYEVVTGEGEKNLAIEDNTDNINTDDFIEIITALKCKLCTYITQDKLQLLEHIQEIHLNATINAEPKEDSKNVDEDHHLTDIGSDEAGKENLTDDSANPDLMTEHADQHVESSETERSVKISKTLSSEYMRNKKMIELTERNVKCSHQGCPYKFATEEIMQQHILCHTESETATTFKCNVCRDMKFTKWRQCSLHLWKKHEIDVGLFTCKICQAYKSATMVKLLTHMRVHSETREYECPECGKCFKQASQLRNHRVMHLDRKALEVTRWYTSKKCEMCGKTYANSKCLKNHVQAVHSKLRPYVCNVCGHASARKAMLQMHLRQHTGDKPFSCEICKYKTGDHNTLRRHIMQHTDNENVEVFPGNIAAAQLVYSCLGAFSKDGDTLEANLMSSSTSADGTSQTITIQIPSKHLEVSLPTKECLNNKSNSTIEQEDDETMHCFLKIPREEEESIDTGGITIPAEPEETSVITSDIEETNVTTIDIDS
ncbi:hypothetical protein X777_03149 [Ooceraea biroi]|uniref:C2H2-type domain-containing protein n=1 Tax=Ooceraea biroi TaxID=2015173 RepID=A0A026WLP5_OOCBI|nr:hypothetical protein X777_03149 [Ooceraea biroi]